MGSFLRTYLGLYSTTQGTPLSTVKGHLNKGQYEWHFDKHVDLLLGFRKLWVSFGVSQ